MNKQKILKNIYELRYICLWHIPLGRLPNWPISIFSANVADLFLAAAFIMQTQFTGGRVRDSALNFILIMKSVYVFFIIFNSTCLVGKVCDFAFNFIFLTVSIWTDFWFICLFKSTCIQISLLPSILIGFNVLGSIIGIIFFGRLGNRTGFGVDIGK